MPERDELNFWAWDRDKPGLLRWGRAPEREWPVTSRSQYEELFAGQAASVVCGECSVVYLESAFAIERLVKERPDVKLVCSLREPVSRAISGYAMGTRSGASNDSLDSAFDLDRDRVRTGEYMTLLQPILELVGRSQLHLLNFDDLIKRPEEAKVELAAFLGIDPSGIGDLAHDNAGGLPQRQWLHRATTHPTLVRRARRLRGSVAHKAVRRVRSANLGVRPQVSDAHRRSLESHYRPELKGLQEATGFDTSGWLASYNVGEISQ